MNDDLQEELTLLVRLVRRLIKALVWIVSISAVLCIFMKKGV